MNRSIRHTFLTATAACGLWLAPATAQTTATTDPVGAMTMTIPAGSDTRFSVPMHRPAVFNGRVESVNAGSDQIILADSPNWDPNEYVRQSNTNPSPVDSYRAIVTSGSQNGAIFPIVSNTHDSLVVDVGLNDLNSIGTDAGSGVGNGDSLMIVPSWSLGVLFDGVVVPDQTKIFVYPETDGINKSPSTIYTYFASVDGWGDGQSPTAVDFSATLELGDGYLVRIPEGSDDLEFAVNGEVAMFADRKVVTTWIPSQPSDYTFAITTPIPVTIGETNLNIEDQTKIFVYDNSDISFNKSPSIVLTYFASVDGWGDGKSPNPVDDSFELKPGTSYVIRKPGAAGAEIVETSFNPPYVN